MLPREYLRENADRLVSELPERFGNTGLERYTEIERQRRDAVTRLEEKRRRRNELTAVRAKPSPEGIAEMKALKEEIRELEALAEEADRMLEAVEKLVPNVPHASVPRGPDETANRVERSWGELPRFDFAPQPHWDLAPALGLVDFERGVKVSGSRFYFLKGLGARLQRAVIAWMLDLHIEQHGYTEIYPPYLVRSEALIGTGQLPKFAENQYHDEPSDLWMIPTAEVPVTNMHRDEILDPGTLPLDYVAYSACFRREQFSGGRDTRGIKRGHQFDKVEMVKFAEPEASDAALTALVQQAADVLEALDLPYRVVQMCTGDLSFTAARKFDVEVWAPGCGEWLEVSSCSSFRDFQARRANIRFRPAGGGKPELVHTLNGSGLALPRVMIAVLESFQRADGTVVIPEALRPFLGGEVTIGG